MDRDILNAALTDLEAEQARLDARSALVAAAVAAVRLVLDDDAVPSTEAAQQPSTPDPVPEPRHQPPSRRRGAKGVPVDDDQLLELLRDVGPATTMPLAERLPGLPNRQAVYWALRRLETRDLAVEDRGVWVAVGQGLAAPDDGAQDDTVDDAAAATDDGGVQLDDQVDDAHDDPAAADDDVQDDQPLPSTGDDVDQADEVDADEQRQRTLALVRDTKVLPDPDPDYVHTTALDADKLTDLVGTYGDTAHGIAVPEMVKVMPWAVRSRLDGYSDVHAMLAALAEKGIVERRRGGRWGPGPAFDTVAG